MSVDQYRDVERDLATKRERVRALQEQIEHVKDDLEQTKRDLDGQLVDRSLAVSAFPLLCDFRRERGLRWNCCRVWWCCG